MYATNFDLCPVLPAFARVPHKCAKERNSVRNNVQLVVEHSVFTIKETNVYKLHVNLYTLFDSTIPIMQLKNSNTLYRKINKITYPSSIECSTNYMMNIKFLQG